MGEKRKYNPAIVVIAYNRVESLKRLLVSISNAIYDEGDINLVISVDYSDCVEEVKQVAESFEWTYGKKRLIIHDKNLGLRNHVLSCGALAEEYGSVILLEDDLYVGKDYYQYTLAAQEFYGANSSIAGVALYSYERNNLNGKRFRPLPTDSDVYLLQYSVTWGQSWTLEQWKRFKNWYDEHQVLEYCDDVPHSITDWSDKSWGKYFAHYMVDQNKFYVVPYQAKSTCFSEKGVHTGMTTNDSQVGLVLCNKKAYNFVREEELVKYDCFFNLKEPERYVKDWNNVYIDTSETKFEGYKAYDFVVTTKRLNRKVVHSYGLELIPIELNIIDDINGRDIFVYDMSKDDTKPSDNTYNIQKYEMLGITVKQAISFGVNRAKEYIRCVILER